MVKHDIFVFIYKDSTETFLFDMNAEDDGEIFDAEIRRRKKAGLSEVGTLRRATVKEVQAWRSVQQSQKSSAHV